jgi:rod shape-determining protein MreC
MRNLLKLLYAYHFLILFIFLEVFSVLFIIKGSNFHRAKFIAASRSFTGGIYNRVNKINSYLSLKEANEILVTENTILRNKLASYNKIVSQNKDTIADSLYNQQYTYQYAKVVNNSVNKLYNYITINKGSRHGLKPDMGVITENGIVGFVKGVSENFSTIISVLNSDFKGSAKIKKNNYYGRLEWNGSNPEYCQLYDITFHVPVQKGDTLVTTGFTSYFPEGILVGTIDDFDVKGNFYKIKVKLSNDFRKLDYVIVVDDIMKLEQINLENSTGND